MERVKITECPRDAMQGVTKFIPTEQKIAYINTLLKVGFDTLDFGSFVSPKAIPQLSDTAQVIAGLDLTNTNTKLLAIVASKKGGELAASYPEITYLGYPFSFSETFLLKNINKTVEQGHELTKQFLDICEKQNKKLLLYLTMAFGNPYGDVWNEDQIYTWVNKANNLGITKITLSDITGESTPELIYNVYNNLINNYPKIDFGIHLHTTHTSAQAKVNAALKAGCLNFDTVLNDKGGCPMTGKELTANLNTFDFINYCEQLKIINNIDNKLLKQAYKQALSLFV